jgi:hypothetical protein
MAQPPAQRRRVPDDMPDHALIERGRRQLALIVLYLLAASIAGAAADLAKGTPAAVLGARLVLTVALCWCLYRGFRWARMLTAVLALSSGAVLLMLAWVAELTWFTAFVLVIAAANVVVAIALVRSRAIKAAADARRVGR